MRALVVEDEHKIANALKRGLEQEGYAVDIAYDGDKGLIEATHEPYDVMILDRMLPGEVDGVGIIKAVRKEGIHTPILFLTAKDQTKDKIEGLDAGADDYLIKPFAFDELLARLRALLRRPPDSLDTVLSYQDLSLNTATFEVTRAKTPVQLSQKEFSLLEYLLRNSGRILTKDQIIEHVWDYDADILPNTVEVYVGYLRNKLEKPFGNKPILHTIRGFGYKLGGKN